MEEIIDMYKRELYTYIKDRNIKEFRSLRAKIVGSLGYKNYMKMEIEVFKTIKEEVVHKYKT